MAPFINPWFFYWMAIVDLAKFLFATIFALSLIALIMLTVEHCNSYGEDRQSLSKGIKRLSVVIFLSLLIMTLIPSKEAVYQIMIMQQITPDNIEMFKGEAKNLVDYIIQKSAEISK